MQLSRVSIHWLDTCELQLAHLCVKSDYAYISSEHIKAHEAQLNHMSLHRCVHGLLCPSVSYAFFGSVCVAADVVIEIIFCSLS